MTQNPPESGALAGATGSGDAVCFGGERPPVSTTPQKYQASSDHAVREARLELLREAIHEACWFVQLHAAACQTLAEAGDDAGLLHSLARPILYAKEAARSGNDLRALREGAP
jgi:hypothetical protein